MSHCEERLKCENDFKYFAENYLKVWTPQGMTACHLWPCQEMVLQAYNEHSSVIGRKFRQGGFSTFNVLYGLWDCMFKPSRSHLYVTGMSRWSLGLLDIARWAIKNLPDWLVPRLIEQDYQSIVFADTESKMHFRSIKAAASLSCTHLYVEEADFFSEMDEYWPQLPTQGKVFVWSTPNQRNKWFAKTWQAAVKGENDFFAVDPDYSQCPTYTEEFVAKMKSNLGEKAFRQEVLKEFVE